MLALPFLVAHFILQTPTSWLELQVEGSPQKLGPCGDEFDGTSSAQPTGVVTAYQVGDTITITINETIFHPGHYRIALAQNDRSELPPEPIVDASATSPCGTVPIMDPPVFPVLADNVFPHTQPFTTPQTTTVTLPANVTCAKCTLQVIEFMSDHPLNNPGGCFYHHCADIAVGVDAGTPVGSEPEPMTSSGCSCDVAPRDNAGTFAILGALVTGLSCAYRASRRRRCR